MNDILDDLSDAWVQGDGHPVLVGLLRRAGHEIRVLRELYDLLAVKLVTAEAERDVYHDRMGTLVNDIHMQFTNNGGADCCRKLNTIATQAWAGTDQAVAHARTLATADDENLARRIAATSTEEVQAALKTRGIDVAPVVERVLEAVKTRKPDDFDPSRFESDGTPTPAKVKDPNSVLARLDPVGHAQRMKEAANGTGNDGQ